MTVDGHPAQVEAYLETPAGLHLALDIARHVYDDQEAFEAYAIGLARYAPAVERVLDSMLDDLARASDAEVAADPDGWGT